MEKDLRRGKENDGTESPASSHQNSPGLHLLQCLQQGLETGKDAEQRGLGNRGEEPHVGWGAMPHTAGGGPASTSQRGLQGEYLFF